MAFPVFRKKLLYPEERVSTKMNTKLLILSLNGNRLLRAPGNDTEVICLCFTHRSADSLCILQTRSSKSTPCPGCRQSKMPAMVSLPISLVAVYLRVCSDCAGAKMCCPEARASDLRYRQRQRPILFCAYRQCVQLGSSADLAKTLASLQSIVVPVLGSTSMSPTGPG